MKITDSTAERLQMTGFPLGLAIGPGLAVVLPLVMAAGYARTGMTGPALALGGLGVLLGGGAFATVLRRRTLTLDRGAGTLTITERGLIGAARVQVRPLAGLTGASVQTHVSRTTTTVRGRRKTGERRLTRPVLVFAAGRTEPLWQAYASGEEAGQTAAAINARVARPAP
jgi:hypothetical protein